MWHVFKDSRYVESGKDEDALLTKWAGEHVVILSDLDTSTTVLEGIWLRLRALEQKAAAFDERINAAADVMMEVRDRLAMDDMARLGAAKGDVGGLLLDTRMKIHAIDQRTAGFEEETRKKVERAMVWADAGKGTADMARARVISLEGSLHELSQVVSHLRDQMQEMTGELEMCRHPLTDVRLDKENSQK